MIIDKVPGVMGRLAGKVAVVTGAGRGIGREAARVLARLGAKTVIAELRESGAETERLIRAAGDEALFIQTDVANEQSVEALYDQVMAAYGKADILVNNAVTFSFGPLWQIPLAEWDRVMAVNLRGAFLCIRAFLPQMRERMDGVVITMESAEGMPYMAPYLATKVGLRSLALSLAHEVGEESGLSVFCFGPGMVQTPGIEEALEQLAPLYGLSRAEFIQISGGAMIDPEVCATGLAGTVLHAQEFHGEQTGFSSGLARLGLSVTGELWAPTTPATAASASAAAEPPPGPPATDRPSGLPAAALTVNRELEEILRANIREYSELTLFMRPLVKRMFQQGTGLKVEDWLAKAESFSLQLERMAAGQDRWPPGEPADYIARLQRLADFIRKQETDARGYFKHQADLDRALEALNQRRAVALKLAALLDESV